MNDLRVITRLLEEAGELLAKINDLAFIMDCNDFNDFNTTQQHLLKRQYKVMKEYYRILLFRICNLSGFECMESPDAENEIEKLLKEPVTTK